MTILSQLEEVWNAYTTDRDCGWLRFSTADGIEIDVDEFDLDRFDDTQFITYMRTNDIYVEWVAASIGEYFVSPRVQLTMPPMPPTDNTVKTIYVLAEAHIVISASDNVQSLVTHANQLLKERRDEIGYEEGEMVTVDVKAMNGNLFSEYEAVLANGRSTNHTDWSDLHTIKKVPVI